jgi:hypothetical protein
MADLTQQVTFREGSIEYLTTNEIRFNHRGDKVTLRGPLHAMVRFVREDGREKSTEELVLKTPNDTKTIENKEKDDDRYDVQITDLGPLPQSSTMLDFIVDRKHIETTTASTIIGRHRDDMVRLKGPGRFKIEYKDKHGRVTKAEDFNLNTPNDVREFVNRKDEEDMFLTGAFMGAAAAAPTAAFMATPSPPPPPPPMPAPAPMPFAQPSQSGMSGGFLGLPEGTLLKSPNDNAVYVIEGGRKRHIMSPQVVAKYGYNMGAVRLFSDVEVNAIPTGDPKT